MQKHIHILGICGTFMGGLAIIARELGYKVTGSDENIYPPMSDTLLENGIEILAGYKPQHLDPKPECVLVGNVCSRGNPALEYALNHDIHIESGPAWLAKHVLNERHVLAVSGTHGKTTTTSMLTWILQYAGLNPGYLIGGVANNFKCSAKLGSNPFFVIEADEYDSAFFDKRPKFLHYFPRTLIINNIEFDHGDIYQDLAAIKTQFHQLIKTVPGNGMIIYPDHDAVVKEVLTKGVWSKKHSFRTNQSSLHVKLKTAEGSDFEVCEGKEFLGQVTWNMLGRHNVDNALAAILAARDVGVSAKTAIAALNEFKGVKRRLEFTGQARGVSVYDDFAHHPTAILKTLEALRARVGSKPIIAVVQFGSNTMKRGGHNPDDIAAALNQADRVVMLNPQFDRFYLDTLLGKITAPMKVCENVNEIIAELHGNLRDQDQVLIMSNKGFDGLQKKLLKALDT